MKYSTLKRKLKMPHQGRAGIGEDSLWMHWKLQTREWKDRGWPGKDEEPCEGLNWAGSHGHGRGFQEASGQREDDGVMARGPEALSLGIKKSSFFWGWTERAVRGKQVIKAGVGWAAGQNQRRSALDLPGDRGGPRLPCSVQKRRGPDCWGGGCDSEEGKWRWGVQTTLKKFGWQDEEGQLGRDLESRRDFIQFLKCFFFKNSKSDLTSLGQRVSLGNWQL